MPTHFDPDDFEQNFPASADVFPTAIDNENYVDAILFNSLGASIEEIEAYLIEFKSNIEAEVKDSFVGGEGLLTFNVPSGRYPAGKTATAQDEDLAAENIKSGVVLFGVTGTLAPGGDEVMAIGLPDVISLNESPMSASGVVANLVNSLPVIGIPTVTSP